MTPENGSTEIWLGTHNIADYSAQVGKHGERASGVIKKDVLEERRTERPPSQPVVKKGSVVIRDLRLWHNGRPNLTEEIRVMLAMIHFAPWYRYGFCESHSDHNRLFADENYSNTMTIELAEELRPLVEKYRDTLQVQSTFLPERTIMERYMKRGFGNEYDFDQIEKFEMPICSAGHIRRTRCTASCREV